MPQRRSMRSRGPLGVHDAPGEPEGWPELAGGHSRPTRRAAAALPRLPRAGCGRRPARGLARRGHRSHACRLARVSGVAAEIAFDRATKRYPGRAEPAVRELTLTV